MTKIVNFYGAPGSGKTTMAADLFARMKKKGLNVELIGEYIKPDIYQGRKLNDYDQFEIFGNQIKKEAALLGKVDYILTDGPIPWNTFHVSLYCRNPVQKAAMALAAQAYLNMLNYDNHKVQHIFVNRVHAYNPSGRYQSVYEADEMASKLKNYLGGLGVEFSEVNSDETLLVAEIL